MTSPYEHGLDRTPANFQPLTPLTLLERLTGESWEPVSSPIREVVS